MQSVKLNYLMRVPALFKMNFVRLIEYCLTYDLWLLYNEQHVADI